MQQAALGLCSVALTPSSASMLTSMHFFLFEEALLCPDWNGCNIKNLNGVSGWLEATKALKRRMHSRHDLHFSWLQYVALIAQQTNKPLKIRANQRDRKMLPCPGVLLRLLIDRTSHCAILHRCLPGKVPLFLWATVDMKSLVNKEAQQDTFTRIVSF